MTINDRLDDEIGDLLTLHEVAELLRVPEATLRYWRHCKTGPKSYKIGRHVAIDGRTCTPGCAGSAVATRTSLDHRCYVGQY